MKKLGIILVGILTVICFILGFVMGDIYMKNNPPEIPEHIIQYKK